ncbi:MAG: hypothetical protein P9M05_05735 [Candidatus Stygibacter australis]|nr:hypothetical protein [Candidatus Stygibacter australis]
MKKNIIIYLILLILLQLHSQDFNMEDFQAPSMPAAFIIGLQVDEVCTPRSLGELETAILANCKDEDNNFIIPENFAFEINTNFILNKPFNYSVYKKNNFFPNIKNNTNFSFAFTRNFVIKDSTDSNAFGISFRTIIFNGKPRKEVITAFEKANINVNRNAVISTYVSNEIMYTDTSVYNTMSSFINFVLDSIKADMELNLTDSEYKQIEGIFSLIPREKKSDDLNNNINEKFIKIHDKLCLTEELEKLRSSLMDLETKRYGLRLEANFASAIVSPTNRFNHVYLPKYGAWFNCSLQPENFEQFDFVGMLRIIFNNIDFYEGYCNLEETDIVDHNLDIGAKVTYKHKKLSLNAEYIHRYRKIEFINNNEKYLCSINYNIKDDTVLTYNLVKNFDDPVTSEGNFTSGFSINLGFGLIKVSDILSSLKKE